MKEEFESPVYHVHRVPVEKVRANSYNPNHVAAPRNEIAGIKHLGRWLYYALCMLLYSR